MEGSGLMFGSMFIIMLFLAGEVPEVGAMPMTDPAPAPAGLLFRLL